MKKHRPLFYLIPHKFAQQTIQESNYHEQHLIKHAVGVFIYYQQSLFQPESRRGVAWLKKLAILIHVRNVLMPILSLDLSYITVRYHCGRTR